MDDEPQFLAALERALVEGARDYSARQRRRRRLAVAGASLGLLAFGVVGVIAVQGGGGTSDDAVTAQSSPDVAAGAMPTAADPAPTTTSTTTSTSTTTTTTTTTTTIPPVSTTTPNTIAAPPAPPCELADRRDDDQFPLRRCDFGWGVVWVRNALVARGDLVESDESIADFTDAVDAAVRRFQQANGLEVDGLVGPQTWFALYPDFLDVSGDLAWYDLDGNGRIEPFEVAGMSDSNSVCDVPTADDCPPTTAEP